MSSPTSSAGGVNLERLRSEKALETQLANQRREMERQLAEERAKFEEEKRHLAAQLEQERKNREELQSRTAREKRERADKVK
jgi:hypothetical protein